MEWLDLANNYQLALVGLMHLQELPMQPKKTRLSFTISYGDAE
jgi:hypothetical protein